jgi:group I intron endonuclease
MGTVYRAYCHATGKSYIGYTKQKFKSRRQAHREAAKDPTSRSGARSAFYEALREHGWSNFQWTVLHVSDDLEDLLETERAMIQEFNTLIPNGYNLDANRARPVRDDVTGEIYESIRSASKGTRTGHVHVMRSCNTGMALANGKKFSWVIDEVDEN